MLYKIPTGANREYGTIQLANGPSFPEASAAEGWVKVRDDAGKKDDSETTADMVNKLGAAEARAKADSKGLWAESGGRIESAYELPDPKAFAEEYKGKDINGK